MMPSSGRIVSGMTTTTLLSPALLASVFALACAHGCDQEGDPETAPDAPEIAGHWVSDCLPSPQADGTTQYLRLDFTIGDADWALDYVTHGDDACANKLVTVHIAGPYTLERESETVEGAWEARFGFTTKTIRPEVDGLRDYLNSLDGCGAAEFATGVAQDVLQTGCLGFGQHPGADCPADYDVVKRDGDDLFFGARPADNDMCTAAKRPTALAPVANHKR
ncbi:hypothetical protein [Nannocystis radixulma]|uniref:APCDD1 domain-containing protein n=1 Tax=Nannocystis radixulma TaxID=2995305 RepID=A0ABT5BDD7_9BACT|nr:hypothetical protein [Nannocystis radixulma]MDC0672159.1 hypothetical protein [Nannocystis radixulma]